LGTCVQKDIGGVYYRYRLLTIEILTAPNTDGLINCLRQPGLLHYQPPKSMRVNIQQLIKSCGTGTDPATETKSIGLPADARVSSVFCSAPYKIHLDEKPSARKPGLCRQDNFIMT
jgi:hypothetical protein